LIDEIYIQFLADLEDIEHSLACMKDMENFSEQNILENINDRDDFLKKAVLFQDSLKKSKFGFSKIPGTLILYICGRYENFIKSLIEEYSIRLASKHNSFTNFPQKFKETIVKNTAIVVQNPSKFGFDETNRNKFINNLSKNINENDFSNINHKCISITEGNLRSTTVSELFKIVGIEKIWEEVSKQAKLKTHFSTEADKDAKREATQLLDKLMRFRNEIAHPSDSSFTWPSIENVIDYIYFLKTLAEALKDIVMMKVTTLNNT